MNHSICAVCASGAIGNHPLDADAWSGSSRFFFTEIQRRGALHSTIGGELPFVQKLFYALLRFSPNKSRMIQRLYTGTGYRNALSKLLAAKIRTTDFPQKSLAIQLGSMFNINEYFPDHVRRASYNDGNFIMLMKSPAFDRKNISAKIIDAAIEYERNVLNGLHLVFTMSEYIRQSFIHDYGLPAEKVHCIGAGINLQPGVIQNLLQDGETSKDYSNPEVLYIGADFRRKGGETLLKAFRQVRSAVPKVRLHIVGPSRPPADKAEDNSGITWHGFLNKDNADDLKRLKSLFFRSSLFVLPSIYEPFGISPLEAMLNGIPCIVSGRWALPEIVPEGKVGEHITPGNADELAMKMTFLLQNPDKIREYGLACRPWVTENFLWQRVVDRLIKVVD